MYSALVNNKQYSVQREGSTLMVNGRAVDWSLSAIGERHYHILWNNRRYRIEVVGITRHSKALVLKVNGTRCEVTLRDRLDLLLAQMGLSNNSAGKVNSIKAPMPGLILEINVQPGDAVIPGDKLLVLEAMKMENIIKSSGEGTVKAVHVSKGQGVEKGQVLIEF